MGKIELESALATLETWIQVFGVLVAIGILGEVGVGVRHWLLDRRLQTILHVEDQERETHIARSNATAETARREGQLATQRAAEAEMHLADANKAAAEANAKAEAFRLDIVNANKGASEASVRAAIAEKAAADAQLALSGTKRQECLRQKRLGVSLWQLNPFQEPTSLSEFLTIPIRSIYYRKLKPHFRLPDGSKSAGTAAAISSCRAQGIQA